MKVGATARADVAERRRRRERNDVLTITGEHARAAVNDPASCFRSTCARGGGVYEEGHEKRNEMLLWGVTSRGKGGDGGEGGSEAGGRAAGGRDNATPTPLRPPFRPSAQIAVHRPM